MSSGLLYSMPHGWGSLSFSDEVLKHFEAHKQRTCLAREAGGQLFATFDDRSVMAVVDATGPRRTDKRSVFSYQPDRAAERIEIADRFERGLHFVGDWHTHRQRLPSPSEEDKQSILESVNQSSHDLVGFVLVIVGQAKFPEGLHVSLHSRDSSVVLTSVRSVQK